MDEFRWRGIRAIAAQISLGSLDRFALAFDGLTRHFWETGDIESRAE